jgi:hypothetical protein
MPLVVAIAILAAGLVILALTWSPAPNHHPARTVTRLRVEDVGLLTSTFLRLASAGSQPTMSNLLADIQSRGLKLNNPIPRDTNAPCYRIVANKTVRNYSENPTMVIIEENDNVADSIGRVRGLADGSVALARLKPVANPGSVAPSNSNHSIPHPTGDQ